MDAELMHREALLPGFALEVGCTLWKCRANAMILEISKAITRFAKTIKEYNNQKEDNRFGCPLLRGKLFFMSNLKF